ncbi:hypothetical protein ABIE79_010079 [Bradyrhizobium diazoefficiens]
MREQTFATVLWEKGASGKFAKNSKSAPINSGLAYFPKAARSPSMAARTM